MKTLKKTLCLVLAMVMVFGLCAVSASAKLGYSDTDDITYKEAVDVMSGIGILSGDSRGFRPTADITRAEAAKIMAYIIIGNAKQADAVKATSDPFADVPASHWAAGYIQYCVTSGVIMGKADGYHPNDNVTGLEFAAMLLRALGYGKQGEFVGSDWAINTSKFALRLGIFDGNLAGASATEEATREECALYAFNAITKVDKVSYSSLLGNYIVTGTELGSASDANKKSKFKDDFDLKNTKGDEDDDDFGRIEGYYWYVDKPSNRVTDYYVAGDKLKEVYTTGVTGAEIFNLLGLSKSEIAAANLTVYVDSATPETDAASATDGDEWHKDNLAKGKTKTLNKTGNGVETYVYCWFDDSANKYEIRVCIINTYMVKVGTVTKATATKDAKTTIDSSSASAYSLSLDANGYETDEFEKGDYVLITQADGVIKSMEAVKVKETEVTRYTKDGDKISIVAGGDTHKIAEKALPRDDGNVKAADTTNVNKGIVDGDDHKLYLDKNGYLYAVESVKADTKYVYVAAVGVKNNDGKLSTGKVLQAEIYYADGTSDVVVVNTKAGADTSENAFKMTAEGVKAYDDKAVDENAGIYTLSWKDDKAVLKPADADNLSGTKVTKGDDTANSNNKFDNKTVFFYVSGEYEPGEGKEDLSVAIYTGIKNVPKAKEVSEAELKAVILKDKAVKAALVETTLVGDDGDTVYFFTGTEDSTDKIGSTVIYTVYAKGEQTDSPLELKYADPDKADKAIEEADSAGFYYVKGDNKLAEVATAKGGITYVKEATIASTTGFVLTVDDEKYRIGDANIVDLRDTDDTVSDAENFAKIGESEYANIYIYFSTKDGEVFDLYILDKPAD